MESANKCQPPPPPLPPSPFFSSLPKDIVMRVLARISRSYYPTLSLVSRSFRLLIHSEELVRMRCHLGTREVCVYVCLKSSTHLCDQRWFSLWIKPDDHQTLTPRVIKSTGNLLLRIPSSYSPGLPIFHETIGSEIYEIGGQNKTFSTDVWVYNKLVGVRRRAPSMMTARKNALSCSLDGKLYVMGGCDEEDLSSSWAEVFDPHTQIWEPLPDPGADLRFSSVRKLDPHQGNVYVRTNDKNFVYLVKQSRWEVVDSNIGDSMCEIDNVLYLFNQRRCLWCDQYSKEWKLVKGLTSLDQIITTDIHIRNYGGKLLIFWSEFVYPLCETKLISCAVILLEKHSDGEIWGHIEWTDIVLQVPQATYTLFRCMFSLQ